MYDNEKDLFFQDKSNDVIVDDVFRRLSASPIMPVPIFSSGTLFQAVPCINHCLNGTQMGFLTLPPGFSIMYAPASANMGFTMNSGQHNPMPSHQETATLPQRVDRNNIAQNGGQGVPMINQQYGVYG